MERNANDFDEVVMNELFGKSEPKPFQFFDPIKPIIDKLNLKIEDSIFGSFYEDTPTFI